MRGGHDSRSSVMRRLRRPLWLSFNACAVLTAAMVCLTAPPKQATQDTPAPKTHDSAAQSQPAVAEYVDSKTCGQCHRRIFNSFSQTDMGRSMTEVDTSFFAKFPTSASITSENLNRRFEVYARDGKLYQSESAFTPDGKEEFRNTQQIEYLIGARANGLGGIVQRGGYLFEGVVRQNSVRL